ncbi:TetR/AcrR family transcriptional regulator [Megasphaera sp. AM44-1BH]|nr:TetR/AcrR family transcriptional regulator [Megasphaera sp. AM44-1BH]
MNEKKPYKSDRRTRYTRQVIRETFLAMLQECSFEKVTVTALCRRADVTRATFYLHYRDEPLPMLWKWRSSSHRLRMKNGGMNWSGLRVQEMNRLCGSDMSCCRRVTGQPMRRSTGRSLKMRVWPGIFWNVCMNWKRKRFPASCNSMA